jgi:hypothetical protein
MIKLQGGGDACWQIRVTHNIMDGFWLVLEGDSKNYRRHFVKFCF